MEGDEYEFDEQSFDERIERDAAGADAEEKKRDTQAQQLSKIAKSTGLFHAPDGTGYADISVGGHRETYLIRSKSFRSWVLRKFYDQYGGVPSSNAIQSALGLIEAMAHFDGPERTVYLRVASHEGKLYVDLASKYWGAIEIDEAGWRQVSEPPVRFRRASGMLPLPVPVGGGRIKDLRKFLNVKTDDDFILAVSWLLAALSDKGPYPVLALLGEQGSAKSTFATILRSLVDPNTAPLRALPREDRDLFIAANNAHVLAFDNISGMPNWISDTLCRLATGGGFSVRQLYTDQDEVLFDSRRPIILNGIEDYVTRADLADRSLFLRLHEILEEDRKAEHALMADFERERPRILGTLLDAVSHGLKRLPTVKFGRLPRMADFAKWATACETAIWPAGTFMRAYNTNRADVVDTVIEADPVATAVLSFMESRTEWDGTASDLLGAISLEVTEAERRDKGWPKAPNRLSGKLNRQKTFLRQVGISITMSRQAGGARTRLIYIKKENKGNQSSQPSQSSRDEHNVYFANDLAGDDSGDDSGDDMQSHSGTVPSTVPAKALKNKAWDDGDDRDDKIPPSSCAYCKQPTDGTLAIGGVYLHRECVAAWDNQEAKLQ